MSLKIIAGSYQGKSLSVGNRSNGVRPTSNLLRGTVFDLVRGNLPGSVFLDLFAGSGAVGFEALSQGVSRVDLVEQNPEVFELIQQNALVFPADSIRLHQADALEFCTTCQKENQSFDLIFADPPFQIDFTPIKAYTQAILAKNGILLIQFPTRTPPVWTNQADKVKKYGESSLAIFYN